MIVPCYYITPFGCLWALFYTSIIFGTKLLTGGPTRIAVFFAYFSISKKRNIKRSPNGMKPLAKLFLEQNQSQELGVHVRRYGRCSRGWGRPPGHAPLPRGTPVAPPTHPLHPYIPMYRKTSRTEDRSGVPPRQASVATKNLSGALPDTLPEGGSFTGGHLHHPGTIHDEEGVVHPWG